MVKKQEPLRVIIRSAGGTTREDISRKEWLPERRQMIAEAVGGVTLGRQGLLNELRNQEGVCILIIITSLLFITNFLVSREVGKINLGFFLLSLSIVILVNWLFWIMLLITQKE